MFVCNGALHGTWFVEPTLILYTLRSICIVPQVHAELFNLIQRPCTTHTLGTRTPMCSSLISPSELGSHMPSMGNPWYASVPNVNCYVSRNLMQSTTEEAAKDIAAFVAIFFEHFTKFKGRAFHMAGESYGGRYIPVFAAAVYDQNPKLIASGITPINLTSIMIGMSSPSSTQR